VGTPRIRASIAKEKTREFLANIDPQMKEDLRDLRKSLFSFVVGICAENLGYKVEVYTMLDFYENK